MLNFKISSVKSVSNLILAVSVLSQPAGPSINEQFSSSNYFSRERQQINFPRTMLSKKLPSCPLMIILTPLTRSNSSSTILFLATKVSNTLRAAHAHNLNW